MAKPIPPKRTALSRGKSRKSVRVVAIAVWTAIIILHNVHISLSSLQRTTDEFPNSPPILSNQANQTVPPIQSTPHTMEPAERLTASDIAVPSESHSRSQQHHPTASADTTTSQTLSVARSKNESNAQIPPHGNDEPADRPLPRYHKRMQAATEASAQLDAYCVANPITQSILPTLLDPVFDCLHMNASQPVPESLAYPITDAHAHFNHIRVKLYEWAQRDDHVCLRASGFSGPWIENWFISHFESMYDRRISGRNATTSASELFCMYEIFGPYIPIFIPWTDHFRKYRRRNLPGLWSTIRSVLRPNVPYIVVVQNDEGLLARVDHVSMQDIPNIVVLSAGGYGHVPIPLLKQTETPLVDSSSSINPARITSENDHLQHSDSPQYEYNDPKDRKYIASFVGGRRTAPHNMRMNMINQLSLLDADLQAHAVNNNHSTNSHDTHRLFAYYGGPEWRGYMASSCFSFCPRGFGRTSYHLMEALQMGLIPIHVYLDVPWVPYLDLIQREQLAIIVKFDAVGKFARDELVPLQTSSPLQHSSWTFDKIRQIEGRILSYRDSHFTFEGVIKQIGTFMVDPRKSDLRCQALPESVRAA